MKHVIATTSDQVALRGASPSGPLEVTVDDPSLVTFDLIERHLRRFATDRARRRCSRDVRRELMSTAR